MQNEFNGFSLFNDVEEINRQAYNRVVVTFNIHDMHGPEMAQEYLDNFSEEDKFLVFAMVNHIQNVGAEEVKRQMNNNQLLFVTEEKAAQMEMEFATIN